MNSIYLVHEKMYIQARKNGLAGWGGDKRMAKGGELVSKFFDVGFNLPTGKLLELGCGEGHHSRLFAGEGYEVSGADISQTAINWAQEKADTKGILGNYFVADLTSPDLKLSSKFDVVIDGTCFHCILGSDRGQFLANVYKALYDSGVFFVSSLCSKSDKNEIIYRLGVPYRHVGLSSDIVDELENAGFQIKKIVEHERNEYNHVNIHASKKPNHALKK